MSRLGVLFYFVMIAVLLMLVRIDGVLAFFAHPQAASTPTTAPADAMQLMKDVRSFYADSWSMLLTYVTILIGFVGLVLPYLMKRDFRNEAEKVKAEMKNESEAMQKDLRATIATTETSLVQQISGSVRKIEQTYDAKLARVEARSLATSYFAAGAAIEASGALPALAIHFYGSAIQSATLLTDEELRPLLMALNRAVGAKPPLESDSLDRIAALVKKLGTRLADQTTELQGHIAVMRARQ